MQARADWVEKHGVIRRNKGIRRIKNEIQEYKVCGSNLAWGASTPINELETNAADM